MTRIFDESGNHIPVTVVKLISNKIAQVKTEARDGYDSYQIGFYEKRENWYYWIRLCWITPSKTICDEI